MEHPNHLYTSTALARGLQALFYRLEAGLSLQRPLNVYLAGGMAVHLYTAGRTTTDVDAEFDGRIHLPANLVVDVTLDDGTAQVLYLDTNYNSSFALMHEDYRADAVFVDLGLAKLRVHVLSPVDLAVSKIARLSDNDRADIASLVRFGLTSADAIEQRAMSAVAGYVGGQAMLLVNLRDALALARDATSRSEPASVVDLNPNASLEP